MSTFVYITEQCFEDAKLQGFSDLITKQAQRIKNNQAPVGLKYEKNNFFKKQIARRGRLIVKRKYLDGHIIYVFLRLFIKGKNRYKQFRKDMDLDNYAPYDNQLPSDEKLCEWLAKEVAKCPVEPLPEMTDLERALLYDALNLRVDEESGMIAESIQWINSINSPQMNEYEYRSLARQIVKEVVLEFTSADSQIRKKSKEGLTIFYSYFPSWKYLYLYDIHIDGQASNPAEPVQIEPQSKKELLQQSGRIFRADFVLEKYVWFDIQKSRKANLALSPEEVQILNEVAQPEDNRAFPLFINGRPGSGKSTLLYYLFADYLCFYLEHEKELSEHPPLFITYSSSLLRSAQEKVRELVLFDRSRGDSQQKDTLKDALAKVVPRCFKEFRLFLIELLPEAEKAEFELDYCVRFAEFEKWVTPFRSRHGNADIRRLSSETCWHVIRTYIKGMQQETDDYMTVEMYEEMSPRHRTVSLETFRLIEREIWPTYKGHLSEQKLWDDQDLARKVLDLVESGDLKLSRYTAIICDEAQDFTTIELELISLLSLYLKKDLTTYRELYRIPIAFAGDPFQTLNPTGFNWDATKRLFYNLVVRLCDSVNAKDLDININYKELRYNYRSTKHIVQFCNFIQLLRGITFQIPNLLPQTTWQEEASRIPVFFNIDDPIAQDGLKQNKQVMIIIPCDEGRESEFIQEDPFLREIAWDDTKQASIHDILSPMTAKGLEFERVILYKFGNYAHQYLEPLLSQLGVSPKKENREQLLPLEYFFNQLYVGASRAQKKIIIVDTEEGLNNLWQLFKSVDQHDQLLEKYNLEVADSLNEEWTKDDICILTQGTSYDWEEKFDEALLRRADQFFEEGKERQDRGAIILLERARFIYESDHKHSKAKEVQIEICKKKGRYKEAGKLSREIGKYRNALKYFWKALSYEDIVSLGQSEQSMQSTLEYQASIFLQEPGPHTPDIFVRLYQSKENNKSLATYGKEWKKTFAQLVDAIDSYEIKEEQKETLVYALKYFKQSKYLASSQKLAKLMYHCGLYQMTKEVLQEVGITAGSSSTELESWIHDTFAQTLPWPRSAVHLSILGRHEEIIEQFTQYPNRDLALNQWLYLLKAYYQQKGLHWDDVPKDIRDKYILYLLFETDLSERTEKKVKAIDALFNHYINMQKWEQALRWIGREKVLYLQPRTFETLSIPQKKYVEQLINDIARSNLIRSTPHNELNVLTRFLEEILHVLDPDFMPKSNDRQSFFNEKDQLKRIASELDPIVLGAAFESVGRHGSTLHYYRWLSRTNKKQRSYARKRWAKNMLKLIDFYKKQDRNDQASGREQKLQEQLNRWGFTVEEIQKIPDYPNIRKHSELNDDDNESSLPGTFPPESPVPSTVVFQLKQKELSGELLYHHQRWRLRDANDNELNFADGQLIPFGDVVIETISEEKKWEIPLWQIAIIRGPVCQQEFRIIDMKTGGVYFQFIL